MKPYQAEHTDGNVTESENGLVKLLMNLHYYSEIETIAIYPMSLNG